MRCSAAASGCAPILLIEAARLFGVAEEAALDAGAALECVHGYSLVHDDLPAMDDDKPPPRPADDRISPLARRPRFLPATRS